MISEPCSHRYLFLLPGFASLPGAYSQMWVMPWASMVYTWSSDSE